MRGIATCLCGLAILCGAVEAHAEDLVTGAVIVKVIAQNNPVPPYTPAEAFSVVTSGGTGPCASTQITFPSTKNGDLDGRLLSLALSGYLSGKPVRIAHLTGSSCVAANYIALE